MCQKSHPETDRLEAKQLRVCLLSNRVEVLRRKKGKLFLFVGLIGGAGRAPGAANFHTYNQGLLVFFKTDESQRSKVDLKGHNGALAALAVACDAPALLGGRWHAPGVLLDKCGILMMLLMTD